MDRRDFLRLVGSATVLSLELTRMGGRAVRAQGATDLAALGLRELKVVLTDAGYQVSPATTTAGWALVTFENQQSAGDNSADIMALPPGKTSESLLDPAATPTAGPPAWLYQATFAGAPWAPAGTSAQAVVLLTPGEWLIFNGGAPLTPISLTVTEAASTPAMPPDVTTDVDVTLREFGFLGLDKPVPSGQRLWKVTNAGQQPHLMILAELPSGTTQTQYMDGMTAMMTGTPAANGIDPETIRNVGGCATLSTGQALWLALDLAAGTYGAMCFFPDEQTGAPHVLMGMAQVFTVG